MVKPIPEGMHTLTAQLNIDGAAEAIELYKKAFGAEELARAPDPTGKKVWHAMLQIGDSRVFVNDTNPEMGALPTQVTMWIYRGDVDAAYKRAIDAGCKSVLPPTDMFWGDRMGMVADRWGIKWNFAMRVKEMTPAEMQQAQDDFVKNMPKR